MSRVEAFVTGIKTEPLQAIKVLLGGRSSNQSPFGGPIKRSKSFWGADQAIKVTSKLLKINNQERAAAI